MNAEEIRALETKRYAAMLARDIKTLDDMFHEELLYTHSSGVVDTKSTYLAAIASGATRYLSARRRDERIRIVADTAFITGQADLDVEIGGEKKALKIRFLNAWVKTPAGWKFIAWQSCPVSRP